MAILSPSGDNEAKEKRNEHPRWIEYRLSSTGTRASTALNPVRC
jgi:hypothetical protein